MTWLVDIPASPRPVYLLPWGDETGYGFPDSAETGVGKRSPFFRRIHVRLRANWARRRLWIKSARPGNKDCASRPAFPHYRESHNRFRRPTAEDIPASARPVYRQAMSFFYKQGIFTAAIRSWLKL